MLRTELPDSYKQPKSAVDYSLGLPSAHCGICRYYENHTCEKVRGVINPDQWCKLFERVL